MENNSIDLFAPLASLQWVDRDKLHANDYNPNKVSEEMIIVEKNPGQKIDYEVNKTKITFDDDLTLNLAKREEDYAVHIDVCFDEDGALCIGAAAGRSYVAQIDIPPRQYKEVPATSAETTTGEAADDADGSHTPQQTTAREPLPLDMNTVTLTLWSIE